MEISPLLAGLIGAVLGSLTSLGTLVVQNIYQNRRESMRLVFDTAYKDYELRILHLPENRASFPVILAYHQEMARLVEQGRLTPAAVGGVMRTERDMHAAVMAAVNDTSDEDPPPN